MDGERAKAVPSNSRLEPTPRFAVRGSAAGPLGRELMRENRSAPVIRHATLEDDDVIAELITRLPNDAFRYASASSSARAG